MSADSTRSPLQLKRGDMIVCEGDSNTSRRGGPCLDDWPYLRLMNWHEPWPSILGELLFCWWPQMNLTVHNAAAGGSSCKAIAARLDQMVLPHKPDWVLMTTGGNDLRLGIEPPEFKTILGDYAARVHDECGGQTVFIGAWCETPARPGKAKLSRIAAHYDALNELAAERDYCHSLIIGHALARQAAALAEQWEGHSLFSGPDNHYNAVGHRAVAAEVMRAFGLIAPQIPYAD